MIGTVSATFDVQRPPAMRRSKMTLDGNTNGKVPDLESRFRFVLYGDVTDCYSLYVYQLFAEDDDYKECIARFYYSSKSWKTDPPTTIPATLTLLPRAEEIHDLVVASFLYLERERRVKEAATNIRAEVNVLAGMQASMCINTTC